MLQLPKYHVGDIVCVMKDNKIHEEWEIRGVLALYDKSMSYGEKEKPKFKGYQYAFGADRDHRSYGYDWIVEALVNHSKAELLATL